MATTFDTHGNQTFNTHGTLEWGDGSSPVAPWSNEDVALLGYPFSSGPFPWPYGAWTDSDSTVVLGLYPLGVESDVSRSQIGGISIVFRSFAGQVGGVGEVYI